MLGSSKQAFVGEDNDFPTNDYTVHGCVQGRPQKKLLGIFNNIMKTKIAPDYDTYRQHRLAYKSSFES